MAKDYYNILGVAKTANQDEVKKAYRRLAHEHHPDKNGGSDVKFKEINEAYQILGDKKKREQYDQFGSSPFGQHTGGGGAGMNWEDVMRQSGFGGFSQGGFNVDLGDLGDIFSDVFGFGHNQARTRSRARQKGQDIQIELTIDFAEAVFGAEKIISLGHRAKCQRCHGNGAQPGTAIKTCARCKGAGEITQTRSSILGSIQTRTVCPDCAGQGKVNEQNCGDCHGQGRQYLKEEVIIKIPAGIDNGQTVLMSGLGDNGEQGASSGDLYINVRVKPSQKFVRDGIDIKTQVQISISQAALGDKVDIETVYGSVKLKIPAGTQSGKVFKLAGKGVPHLQSSGQGDHLVKINVAIPAKLTKKQKQLFEELKEIENKKSGWF